MKMKPPHHGWHHLGYRDPGALGKIHTHTPYLSPKAQKVPASLHQLFSFHIHTFTQDLMTQTGVDLFASSTTGLETARQGMWHSPVFGFCRFRQGWKCKSKEAALPFPWLTSSGLDRKWREQGRVHCVSFYMAEHHRDKHALGSRFREAASPFSTTALHRPGQAMS